MGHGSHGMRRIVFDRGARVEANGGHVLLRIASRERAGISNCRSREVLREEFCVDVQQLAFIYYR